MNFIGAKYVCMNPNAFVECRSKGKDLHFHAGL